MTTVGRDQRHTPVKPPAPVLNGWDLTPFVFYTYMCWLHFLTSIIRWYNVLGKMKCFLFWRDSDMKWDGDRKWLHSEGSAFSSSKAMCSHTVGKAYVLWRLWDVYRSYEVIPTLTVSCPWVAIISEVTERGERCSLLQPRDPSPREAHSRPGFWPTAPLSLASNANQFGDLHACLLSVRKVWSKY